MSDDERDAEGTGPGPSGPVNEGIHHLEAAARELIHAGRSFLDALESSLGDVKADDLSSFVSRWADVVRPTESGSAEEPYTRIDLDADDSAVETDTDPEGTGR